jgi:hypothetical protein
MSHTRFAEFPRKTRVVKRVPLPILVATPDSEPMAALTRVARPVPMPTCAAGRVGMPTHESEPMVAAMDA